jgi:hypothetical protein
MRTVEFLIGTFIVSAGLGGCSNDSAQVNPKGSGGTSAALGTGGRTSTAGDASTAGASSLKYGDVLEFVAGTGLVPYAIGDNIYGIHGGAFLARSPMGNTITIGTDAGKICIRGNLDEVPGGNYSQYWGVEIGFNLNQGSAPDAGASASADAGDVAQPWVPGNIIGFSFVIEGPTINLIRFKALPAGYDATLESSVFCKPINATSGDVQDGLFTELKQYCWNANANVLLPTGAGLANLSWQLPADVGVGARPFDWCLSELRPILAP